MKKTLSIAIYTLTALLTSNYAIAENSSAVANTTRPSFLQDPCQGMTKQECKQAAQKLKQQLIQKWQQMTPEQKEQFKQNVQQQWQQLTPEQQEQIRQKFKEKWYTMTPEEQQNILQQFKQ